MLMLKKLIAFSAALFGCLIAVISIFHLHQVNGSLHAHRERRQHIAMELVNLNQQAEGFTLQLEAAENFPWIDTIKGAFSDVLKPSCFLTPVACFAQVSDIVTEKAKTNTSIKTESISQLKQLFQKVRVLLDEGQSLEKQIALEEQSLLLWERARTSGVIIFIISAMVILGLLKRDNASGPKHP
jgi:hypothetical protein